MLDPDVDSFLDEAVAYSFVDNHPDRRFRYVVDHSRFAVVDFHGHTLLDRSVRFDVYNVADSVFSEVCAQLDHSLLLEFARERIARASTETS